MKEKLLLALIVITLMISCGADSTTGPSPISTELEVRLSFVMMNWRKTI